MLGDALVYGFSLYVIARGVIWQTRAALVKGAIMATFAAGITIEIGLKLARGVTPSTDLRRTPRPVVIEPSSTGSAGSFAL